MKLVVDGKEWPVPAGAGKVMDVVRGVMDQLAQAGRGMVGMRVNGATVKPEDIRDQWCATPLDEDMEIELTSLPIREMVNHTLVELEKWLPELPSSCAMLARVFQGDDPESGFQYFNEFARLWSEIKHQEQYVVNALGLDLREILVDGKPLLEWHETLNALLREAVEAFEKRDFVLLGDLLEYELTPFAALEAKIVAALGETNRAGGTDRS